MERSDSRGEIDNGSFRSVQASFHIVKGNGERFLITFMLRLQSFDFLVCRQNRMFTGI